MNGGTFRGADWPSVANALDLRSRGPWLSPVRVAVRCVLEQVTFPELTLLVQASFYSDVVECRNRM